VIIFEPEFFNIRADFLQGRRGGLVFFFNADQAREKLPVADGLAQNGIKSLAESRKKLDASGKKSKGPIFTSGNTSQEQI